MCTELVEKFEGKPAPVRPKYRQEGSIKMDL